MNAERERKWTTYFLDECPSEERATIEAEMLQHPDEAAELKRVVLGVKEWAEEPAAVDQLDVEETITIAAAPLSTPDPSGARWYRRAWPWAAAALFVFALSQISFSVTVGDTTIAWGAPSQPADKGTALAERLSALEAQSAETTELVQAVAERTLELQDDLELTAAELLYSQQLEAETRYRDTRRLYDLASASYEP